MNRDSFKRMVIKQTDNQHGNRILDREIHNGGQMDLLKPANRFFIM